VTSRIASLPRGVVDVIAAGEVVERPASVVKELVENALDAGARRVEVDLEDGGRTLVRVRDDGEGMGPEDLALAFAPHATSKIRTVADLATVATYGFRGEALASIGAVSDASVTSRPRGAPAAHRVEDRRGATSGAAPAAHPDGTTVEVRSLFAALPARRKFLRSPPAETARCTETVVRFALARPDVSFLLRVDGKEAFRAPAGESPRERAARALGAEVAERLLPVAGRRGGVSVEGFVVAPEAAGKSRPPQYLAVNGRSVQDRTVGHAVRAAMEGLLTVHRQPAWVLSISLPPGDVDVNVHPAKSEVRFRRPSDVHDAVSGAVRDAVLAGERAPTVGVASMEVRGGVRDAIAAYLGGAPRAPERQGGLAFVDEPAPRERGSEPDAPPPADGVHVLQIRDTFLVHEAADGIAVVDQHALHERVLLERLHARLKSGAVEVQRLLVPEVVDCGAADAARAEAAARVLKRAGLLVSRHGPGAIAVEGVPRALAARSAAAVAAGALARLREDGKRLDADALLHGVLESMACHGAVKAGDPLTPAEARALLAEGRGLDLGGHCAHGRPTELRIPFEELERKFRRRGL
jgi:DNA mismatch repair protein MutL